MAQQKHVDSDQHFLLEDDILVNSFQQCFQNSKDLQAQKDKLVELIGTSADFAAFKSAVQSEFS